VVVIRFGHDWDPQCMQMDEILASVSDQMKNFAVIFLVDISEVPDFNTMYELYDPCTTMFFFRNKHIMVDLGTGAAVLRWLLGTVCDTWCCCVLWLYRTQAHTTTTACTGHKHTPSPPHVQDTNAHTTTTTCTGHVSYTHLRADDTLR
jgi:hypothetical protein